MIYTFGARVLRVCKRGLERQTEHTTEIASGFADGGKLQAYVGKPKKQNNSPLCGLTFIFWICL